MSTQRIRGDALKPGDTIEAWHIRPHQRGTITHFSPHQSFPGWRVAHFEQDPAGVSIAPDEYRRVLSRREAS